MSHIVSVWSPSGGVGKTTLAILLAECLEMRGFKTSVFDFSEDKNAKFLSEKNKLKTKIVSSPKELDNDVEITIVDHQAYSEEDAGLEGVNPDLLIVPIRPVLTHVVNLSKFVNNKMIDTETLPVFNLCAFGRKENLKILNGYPKFFQIKNRGVYERMLNLQCSVFHSDADVWASVNQARKEMEEFADLVIYKLKNILPEDAERKQKVLKLTK